MLVLGIEATAHTFGIGLARDKKILANAWDMYKASPGKGIIPIDSANHHEKVKEQVLEQALKEAKATMDDVDAVAYSYGAGLPPCLKVGTEFAKELANKHKPLVPVCHQVAHIDIGKLTTGTRNPVVLFTSGANTQILAYSNGYYRCFGETMDIGIGNALDKFGREAGLDFPAGPKIEELASKSNNYIELPYVVKGMDLSFSGIITATLNKLKKGAKLEDLCFSLQETLFSMLTEVTERALAHTEKNELLLTGGVAANRRLHRMLMQMCKERDTKVYNVPKEYAGDNGAMIAYSGLLAYKSGITVDPKDADFNPRLRTDQVEVKWNKF